MFKAIFIAGVIAHLIGISWGVFASERYFVALVMVFTFLMICIVAIHKYAAVSVAKFNRKEQVRGMADVTIEQARISALKLLGDESLFRCAGKQQTIRSPELPKLSDTLIAFFGEFGEVNPQRGEAVISWKEIGVSEYDPNFIRIGRDEDFQEIVVRPGSDILYLIRGLHDEKRDGSYKSIYHWVIEIANEMGTAN